jgi:hypothetical protein
MDIFKTIYQDSLGGLSFGFFHSVVSSRSIKLNNEKMETQHKYDMDRMESNHRIEMSHLNEKINTIEKRRYW